MKRLFGSGSEFAPFIKADRKIADMMSSYRANFIAAGDPDGKVLRASSNGVDSYVTEDAGKTWTKAGSVSSVPTTKMASLTAAYSPKGVIALTWQAAYPLSTPSANPPSGEGVARSLVVCGPAGAFRDLVGGLARRRQDL